MVNYQLGKIYKIICNTTGKMYIGSTCESTLARRLANHLKGFNCWKEGRSKKYMSSFNVIENYNYEIILIETYPCNSKDELHSRERFYIESNACENMRIPKKTKAEYYDDNKYSLLEHQREYYKLHKDVIIDKVKTYYKKNKERILEKNKKYYEENKQEKLNYAKEYRNQHNEKIAERKRKYNEEHKEYLKAYKAKWFQENKKKKASIMNDEKIKSNVNV